MPPKKASTQGLAKAAPHSGPRRAAAEGKRGLSARGVSIDISYQRCLPILHLHGALRHFPPLLPLDDDADTRRRMVGYDWAIDAGADGGTDDVPLPPPPPPTDMASDPYGYYANVRSVLKCADECNATRAEYMLAEAMRLRRTEGIVCPSRHLLGRGMSTPLHQMVASGRSDIVAHYLDKCAYYTNPITLTSPCGEVTITYTPGADELTAVDENGQTPLGVACFVDRMTRPFPRDKRPKFEDVLAMIAERFVDGRNNNNRSSNRNNNNDDDTAGCGTAIMGADNEVANVEGNAVVAGKSSKTAKKSSSVKTSAAASRPTTGAIAATTTPATTLAKDRLLACPDFRFKHWVRYAPLANYDDPNRLDIPPLTVCRAMMEILIANGSPLMNDDADGDDNHNTNADDNTSAGTTSLSGGSKSFSSTMGGGELSLWTPEVPSLPRGGPPLLHRLSAVLEIDAPRNDRRLQQAYRAAGAVRTINKTGAPGSVYYSWPQEVKIHKHHGGMNRDGIVTAPPSYTRSAAEDSTVDIPTEEAYRSSSYAGTTGISNEHSHSSDDSGRDDDDSADGGGGRGGVGVGGDRPNMSVRIRRKAPPLVTVEAAASGDWLISSCDVYNHDHINEPYRSYDTISAKTVYHTLPRRHSDRSLMQPWEKIFDCLKRSAFIENQQELGWIDGPQYDRRPPPNPRKGGSVVIFNEFASCITDEDMRLSSDARFAIPHTNSLGLLCGPAVTQYLLSSAPPSLSSNGHGADAVANTTTPPPNAANKQTPPPKPIMTTRTWSGMNRLNYIDYVREYRLQRDPQPRDWPYGKQIGSHGTWTPSLVYYPDNFQQFALKDEEIDAYVDGKQRYAAALANATTAAAATTGSRRGRGGATVADGRGRGGGARGRGGGGGMLAIPQEPEALYHYDGLGDVTHDIPRVFVLPSHNTDQHGTNFAARRAAHDLRHGDRWVPMGKEQTTLACLPPVLLDTVSLLLANGADVDTLMHISKEQSMGVGFACNFSYTQVAASMLLPGLSHLHTLAVSDNSSLVPSSLSAAATAIPTGPHATLSRIDDDDEDDEDVGHGSAAAEDNRRRADLLRSANDDDEDDGFDLDGEEEEDEEGEWSSIADEEDDDYEDDEDDEDDPANAESDDEFERAEIVAALAGLPTTTSTTVGATKSSARTSRAAPTSRGKKTPFGANNTNKKSKRALHDAFVVEGVTGYAALISAAGGLLPQPQPSTSSPTTARGRGPGASSARAVSSSKSPTTAAASSPTAATANAANALPSSSSLPKPLSPFQTVEGLSGDTALHTAARGAAAGGGSHDGEAAYAVAVLVEARGMPLYQCITNTGRTPLHEAALHRGAEVVATMLALMREGYGLGIVPSEAAAVLDALERTGRFPDDDDGSGMIPAALPTTDTTGIGSKRPRGDDNNDADDDAGTPPAPPTSAVPTASLSSQLSSPHRFTIPTNLRNAIIANAIINARDADGNTALHLAAYTAQRVIVKVLLEGIAFTGEVCASAIGGATTNASLLPPLPPFFGGGELFGSRHISAPPSTAPAKTTVDAAAANTKKKPAPKAKVSGRKTTVAKKSAAAAKKQPARKSSNDDDDDFSEDEDDDDPNDSNEYDDDSDDPEMAAIMSDIARKRHPYRDYNGPLMVNGLRVRCVAVGEVGSFFPPNLAFVARANPFIQNSFGLDPHDYCAQTPIISRGRSRPSLRVMSVLKSARHIRIAEVGRIRTMMSTGGSNNNGDDDDGRRRIVGVSGVPTRISSSAALLASHSTSTTGHRQQEEEVEQSGKGANKKTTSAANTRRGGGGGTTRKR